MNTATRERFGAALAHLNSGIGSLEALQADEAADLLPSERKALQKAVELAIPALHEAISPIASILKQAEQRPPARGKVLPAAVAPEPPAAAASEQPAPVAPAAAAPVAPVADKGGVGAGLRALALALRDMGMAARDHADALRELAAARPQGAAPMPAAVAEPPAPAVLPAAAADAPAEPATTGRRRRPSEAKPGARSGAVAADLKISMASLHSRIRAQGGLAVGVTVGAWRVSRIDHGPGGKAVPRWERIEEQQDG